MRMREAKKRTFGECKLLVPAGFRSRARTRNREQLLCGFDLLGDVDVSLVHVPEGAPIAYLDALRIAVAQVTGDNALLDFVVVRGSEWTHCNAGLTGYAACVVNIRFAGTMIPTPGTSRTRCDAWSIFALLTNHGNEDAP